MFFLLIIVTKLFGQSGYIGIPVDVVPDDKQKHVAATMFLSTAGYAFGYGITKSRKKARIIGFATAMVFGGVKEGLDSRPGGTGFDFKDLGADLIGAAIGTITIDIFTGRRERRDRRRLRV